MRGEGRFWADSTLPIGKPHGAPTRQETKLHTRTDAVTHAAQARIVYKTIYPPEQRLQTISSCKSRSLRTNVECDFTPESTHSWLWQTPQFAVLKSSKGLSDWSKVDLKCLCCRNRKEEDMKVLYQKKTGQPNLASPAKFFENHRCMTHLNRQTRWAPRQLFDN